MRKFLIFLCLAICWVVFLSAVVEMPPFGDPANITNRHVVPRYLEEGVEEGGAPNIITGIILNYRGYDTMGEVTVIFTALAGVLAVLKREDVKTSTTMVATSPVGPSLIVTTVVKLMIPFIVLFAVYTILHGDVSPGGGFQGGAVFGASMIHYTLIFGLLTYMRKIRLAVKVPLESAAILSFAIAGFIGLFFGQKFLTFLMPALSHEAQYLLRHAMLLLIEVGIGVATGIIFGSIFASLEKVERI